MLMLSSLASMAAFTKWQCDN